MEFEVAKTAVPKVDEKGVQKVDQSTQWPVWAVEVTAWQGEDEGSQSMVVAVASATKPELRWRQPVQLVGLEMLPWSNKSRAGDIRSGVAFKASEICPVDMSLRSVA